MKFFSRHATPKISSWGCALYLRIRKGLIKAGAVATHAGTSSTRLITGAPKTTQIQRLTPLPCLQNKPGWLIHIYITREPSWSFSLPKHRILIRLIQSWCWCDTALYYRVRKGQSNLEILYHLSNLEN